MEPIIAACGLDCAVCPAHIAWKTDDQDLRVKTAAEWKIAHGFDATPDMINCVGCMTAQDGPRIGHCSQCEYRACASKKGLANCAACGDYPCESLAGFHAAVPKAKEALDALRA